MYFEEQLVSSCFAHILSTILVLYTVDHQLPIFTFGLHVHSFAGVEQFAILVPFYLSFGVIDLAA